jgi:hypothetical protein
LDFWKYAIWQPWWQVLGISPVCLAKKTGWKCVNRLVQIESNKSCLASATIDEGTDID